MKETEKQLFTACQKKIGQGDKPLFVTFWLAALIGSCDIAHMYIVEIIGLVGMFFMYVIFRGGNRDEQAE